MFIPVCSKMVEIFVLVPRKSGVGLLVPVVLMAGGKILSVAGASVTGAVRLVMMGWLVPVAGLCCETRESRNNSMRLFTCGCSKARRGEGGDGRGGMVTALISSLTSKLAAGTMTSPLLVFVLKAGMVMRVLLAGRMMTL